MFNLLVHTVQIDLIYIYNKRNAQSLPGVINHYAKAKILHHVYFAFSEGKLRKLYTKNAE